MTSVAIWADDQTTADELVDRLTGAPGITVSGAAASEAELICLLEGDAVDVVVVRFAGPRSPFPVWLTREAVVVAVAGTGDEMLQVLRAGAMAALPGSSSSAELVAAIQAASAGLLTFPAEWLDMVLGDRPAPAETTAASEAWTLTPRESEVLALMAKGASNKVIARELNITAHTAKFHVASVFSKLKAGSRAEAVAIAARLGLVML